MSRESCHQMARGPQEFAWACAYGVSQYWAYGVNHYAVSQTVPARGHRLSEFLG